MLLLTQQSLGLPSSGVDPRSDIIDLRFFFPFFLFLVDISARSGILLLCLYPVTGVFSSSTASPPPLRLSSKLHILPLLLLLPAYSRRRKIDYFSFTGLQTCYQYLAPLRANLSLPKQDASDAISPKMDHVAEKLAQRSTPKQNRGGTRTTQ